MPFVQNRYSAWFNMALPFSLVYLIVQFLVRLGLITYSGQAAEMTALQWPGVFGWGLVFDLQVLGFFLLPLVLVHLLAPRAAWTRLPLRVTRLLFFAVYTYIWLFTAVAEYFFWQEFGTRFNFIAVDYLVYTTEVIGNIKESYPLYPLLGGMAVLTLLLTVFFKRFLWLDETVLQNRYSKRAYGLVLVALPFILLAVINTGQINLSSNQAIQEVATNGTYDLFSAYRNNELSYKKFYITHDEKAIASKMRQLLEEDESEFVNSDPDDITRLIKRQGPELHKNVIMVVMESMSAEFMGTFGNNDGLTPNLDKLAKTGLFFSDLYATGTRTVRGLEAVTLSVPPTPGQSILRRPDNGNLYSLGYVFQDRGYDTAFIYGGHGYFDNMNEFFSHNGFRIVDRTDFAKNEITFSNVWGVADEDLFNQVMKQGDAAYVAHKPFMYEVMTTSNHRPYTYPNGRIDIPSKGGRSGGVKYADYAVGKFLADAKSKPWFKDTVFIFVADHTAGAGGKIELSPKKYHIPAIFYAPGFIKPQEYKYTASQIDIPPVLLGLLNFSYYSKFYGEDVMHDDDEAENAHAFISNYQKVAYMEHGQLTVLAPMEKSESFSGEQPTPKDKIDNTLLIDTVTYYQYASGWKERMKRIPTVYKK